MEVIIKGSAKEITALVLAVQERRDKMISIIRDMPVTEVDRAQLADTIRSALLGTYSAENQWQQPDSTEHRQKQDEGPHLQEPET